MAEISAIASSWAEELTSVAENLRRSTVQVRGHQTGAGSGVIWTDDGVIITNAHVVRGTKAEVELSDRQILPATVTARNVQRDLVALKVDATDLPAATVGDSEGLRVGELVLAVGNPLGLTGAFTTGIIHAVGSTRSPRSSWIQADIGLAPGNSGGPLANAQGQVIGINAMIVNNLGFAIASHEVQRFLYDRRDRPYLGVSLQPVRVLFNRRRGYGLLITHIESGSPAEMAQLQTGDVLIGVRGVPFQSPNELFGILENSNVSDGLLLEVLREGHSLSVEVILYGRGSQAEAA